jgi:hypothetical protein
MGHNALVYHCEMKLGLQPCRPFSNDMTLKNKLAIGHGQATHFQVVSWGIYNGQIILLVACTLARKQSDMHEVMDHTFDRVRLYEVCTIREQSLGYALPSHPIRHSKIDMCR